jgi:hypothetical protein
MTKPIKFQHGRRVLTFTHDIRHATDIFRFEEAGQRIQLEKRPGGGWVVGRWAWMSDMDSWDFVCWLRAERGPRNGLRRECKDPRALAKAAAALWVSTGE